MGGKLQLLIANSVPTIEHCHMVTHKSLQHAHRLEGITRGSPKHMKELAPNGAASSQRMLPHRSRTALAYARLWELYRMHAGNIWKLWPCTFEGRSHLNSARWLSTRASERRVTWREAEQRFVQVHIFLGFVVDFDQFPSGRLIHDCRSLEATTRTNEPR